MDVSSVVVDRAKHIFLLIGFGALKHFVTRTVQDTGANIVIRRNR